MEISANFAFLKQEFPHVAESASFAERHVFGDPRASCFHARHALERLLKRIYKVEKALKPPKATNLDGYISDPAFRELVPRVVWQKAEYIRRAGNVAVHGKKSPAPQKALDVVHELSHVLYWAGRTYLRKGAESLAGKTFDESLVPKVEPAAAPASVEELDALKAERDAAEEAWRRCKELESLSWRHCVYATRGHQGGERGCPRDPRLERGQDSTAAHRSRVEPSGLVAWWATRPGIQDHGDAQCTGRGIRRLRPVG